DAEAAVVLAAEGLSTAEQRAGLRWLRPAPLRLHVFLLLPAICPGSAGAHHTDDASAYGPALTRRRTSNPSRSKTTCHVSCALSASRAGWKRPREGPER